MYQTPTSAHPVDSPIPPYNPADYAHQQQPPQDPYGYPPAGHNVSRDMPYPNPSTQDVPYFPPPPTVPEEGAPNLIAPLIFVTSNLISF